VEVWGFVVVDDGDEFKSVHPMVDRVGEDGNGEDEMRCQKRLTVGCWGRVEGRGGGGGAIIM
jgi:hypothetical protein